MSTDLNTKFASMEDQMGKMRDMTDKRMKTIEGKLESIISLLGNRS